MIARDYVPIGVTLAFVAAYVLRSFLPASPKWVKYLARAVSVVVIGVVIGQWLGFIHP